MTVTVNWQSVGPGEVSLDGFSGATDSDMLDAAMSYAAAQTYRPTIRMSNRLYNFTRKIIPYHSFHLVGSAMGQVNEVSTPHPGYKTTLHLEIPVDSGKASGSWLDCETNGVVWGMYVGGFNCFSNSTTTQFIRGAFAAGGGIRESTLRDITTQNLYSTLGSPTDALAMTICNITGGWQILEPRTTAVHIGGSDNRAIFDEGVDFFASGIWGNAGEKFMMICDALGRSNIGPIYITASGGWRGLLVKGNKNAPQLIFNGATIEGNGTGGPVDGAVCRVEGGVVTFRDCSFSYSMANPSLTATPNGGVADAGIVEILGSDTQVILDGAGFCLAGTPNTVTTPVVDVAGSAIVRISNVTKGNGGGVAWGAGLPVVRSVGATQTLTTDSSVQVVTS